MCMIKMDIWRILGLSCMYLVLSLSSVRSVSVDCKSQSTLVAELGQTLQIVCIVSDLNNQSAEVHWVVQRNTGPIRIYPEGASKYDETRTNINSNEVRVSLDIHNIDVEDQTTYLIQLTNLNMTDSVNTVIQGPPRITNQFNTIYGKAGSDLLLDCRVQSWPYPKQYTWYYQNNNLRQDSRHQIYDRTYKDRSISHSYLKILRFNQNETGTYICWARNEFGEIQLALEVKVGKDETVDCRVQYKCNDLQTCTLDHGCICLEGYRETSDGRCLDIDECQKDSNNCEQICNNIPASFSCSCNEGYVVDEPNNKCTEYIAPPQPPVNNDTVYAIVGVVGAIVIIIIILVVVFIIIRRNKRNKSSTPPPQYIFEKSSTPSASIVHEFSVNKVEMQHEIGKGRFGQVYLARAWDITGTGTWEPVAVKQTRRDLTDEDKNAFLHEMNLVKRIPYNRNIVRCLGFFNEPMMSMLLEYMPNGDLLTYLRQRRPQNYRLSSSSLHLHRAPITASQIFQFALQCARGIQHLHQNKIIHRDLAARNVLVANDNCCKISDFGLARKVGEDYSYTSRSKRPLPILWMAPEAIFTDRTSNKSDVWSYGILFWEMITLGSRPYPGKSGPQVLEMIKQRERLNNPSHCTIEVYKILNDCWQFNPESRPEFHEIVDDMEMRLDLAEEYIDLANYNIHNYNFIDHVSMSDLDLDQSEEAFLTRSRSRRSLRSLPQIHL